jgi:hypothetical protein
LTGQFRVFRPLRVDRNICAHTEDGRPTRLRGFKTRHPGSTGGERGAPS